jgi:membrane protease YdiL (CAAX protease family)
MSTFKAFIGRHSVLTYFILTFVISWGGILIVIGGPGAIPTPGEQAMKLLPVAIVVMVLGPSVSGILLTGIVYGRMGLREFLSRLLRWRVHARWYVVALLTAPILIAVILFAFSLISPAYIPGIVSTNDRATLLISGIAAGLVAGILEELGWTGFATPQLRLRYGILTSGLIVGFLWGGWHFLVTFWGSGSPSGGFSPELLLPPLLFYVGVLPVYRVLMVWVYDRTESLLIVMLMHATLTANTNFILSPSVKGVPFMVYYLVLAAVLWVVVAIITAANGGRLTRQTHGVNGFKGIGS